MIRARDLLVPGGALTGPLFDSLIERIAHERRELPAGQVIGPYRLLAVLGTGGMATVYLAERADGEFDQRVALKIIRPDRESQTTRELIRRERQILASLHHPHIAQLLDGGTTEDGLIWFAMEPVRGMRIDEFCRDRLASLDARLRLMLQVCDAVQFAHARLLVHRDLKPSNILVTEDGDAKLLDFGIAIAAAEHGVQVPALTPRFASPEQRRDDPITTASDIWQLGFLLGLLVGDHIAARPRRLADLQAVIARATDDDPAARYSSAGELAADVRRASEQRPVTARRGTARYRVRCFVRRHRWSSAGIAFAIASLAALVIVFTASLLRERDAVRRAAERASAATSFMVELFRSGDPSVHRGRPIDARELMSKGVERLRTDLIDQPALRAHLLATIGRVQLAMGEPAVARPLFEEAIALLRGAAGDDHARAEALQGLGEALLGLGDQPAAMAPLLEAVSLIGDGTSAARRRRRPALDLLSMAQLGTGDLDAALATQREAVAIADAEHGPRSVEAALSRKNLGIVMTATATPAERTVELQRSWDIFRAAYGESHPSTVSAKKLYATALLDAGRLDEARPLLEDAVAVQRRLFNGAGLTYAAGLRSLGLLHAAQGQYRRAIDQFQEAEVAFLNTLGDASSETFAWTASDLGSSHEQLGEHAIALGHYERALAIRRRLFAPDHLLIAQSLDGASRQLVRLGRGAEAEALSRESLAIRLRRLPPSSADHSRSVLPLGAARWVAGARAEAHELWDRALDLIERSDGRDSDRLRKARRYIRSFTGE